MNANRCWVLAFGLAALTAVPSCRKERQEATREKLSEAGYELTPEAYFRAAESDDLTALKKMLSGGMALDQRDAKGRTSLHAAAGSGALVAIDFLLDQGLEVDVVDLGGRTPLMEAVLRSTPETVRYLLRQGADPLLKDESKHKPMMLAVTEGRHEMIPELATYVRGDLDDALLAAAILGQAEVIDQLTNFGASIYARLEDGRTPLMLAAQYNQPEAVDILLEIGANRFAMDSEGRMASDLASEKGFDELAARLAAEPQEGDFELHESAELGAEMIGFAETRDGDALEVAILEEGDLPSEEGTEVAVLEDAAEGEGGELGAFGDEDSELPPLVSGGAGPDEDGSPQGTLPVVHDEVTTIEGATVGLPASVSAAAAAGGKKSEDEQVPLVMRSYREKELPLRLEGTKDDVVTMRMAGGEKVEVAKDETIPGSKLKVIRIDRKMLSGKENRGEPMEVSVVELSDEESGVTRELVVGLPALAHDPVALVEDAESGRYYVARTGQKFKSADGQEFVIGDVRPNQVVIENLGTHETTTIPLRGSRG